MKNIIIILLVLCCFAFTQTRKEHRAFSQREFKIDTLKIADKKGRYDIFLTIPIAGIPNLDRTVRNEILTGKEEFEAEVNERMEGIEGDTTDISSDYSCELISVYEDKKFISYSFVNSQYFTGAAHGMTRYRSYNYDLATNRFINFNDYFNFKSVKDSVFLMNLMTRRIAREGVEVKTLRDMDFNLEEDSISFNFDDYEIASYAEGPIRVKIGRKEIAKLIRKN